MKQYRVNTTFRNAGMGHRMEKWGKKQDQDWAGLTVLVVIFQHARLRVNPKVLGQLGPKISLGVAQKAYFMVQLWLPAPFLNRYSIFLAAPNSFCPHCLQRQLTVSVIVPQIFRPFVVGLSILHFGISMGTSLNLYFIHSAPQANQQHTNYVKIYCLHFCSNGVLGPELQCVLDPCIWARIDTCLEYFCQKSAPSELSSLEKDFQMSLHRINLKFMVGDLLTIF